MFQNILQISTALIAFSNKILLFGEMRSGWILGFFAGVLSGIYFFSINFFIYTTVQIGFSILMLYGLFFKKLKSSKIIEPTIVTIISVISVIVMFFTMKGIFSILELIASLAGLWGTFFLARERNLLGWFLYIVMHFTLSYLTFVKNQVFFSHFQLASGIVAICALIKVFINMKKTL